jgi:hypothetical protein
MNTVFLLMARYNGLPIIPVDVVCRDYFQHLNVESFSVRFWRARYRYRSSAWR